MRRIFDNENLEDFLKKSADDLHMPPSPAIWQALAKEMQTRRRRTFLLSSFFILSFFLAGYFLNQQPTPVAAVMPEKPASPKQQKNNNGERISVTSPVPLSNTEQRTATAKIINKQPASSVIVNTNPQISIVAATTTLPAVLSSPITFAGTLVDEYQPATPAPAGNNTVTAKKEPTLPLTIESVTNTYKARSRKWSLQTYFTPTVGYRRPSENKTFDNRFSSYQPASINDVVFHRPDIGFEIGEAARYQLNSRVRLRAGLQLSMQRYDIRVFDHVPEVATIALNSGYAQPTLLNTVTSYRNTTGTQSEWLQNTYVKFSAPVGVETKIKGNEKVYFGVAGTVQPSYLLGDNAYLLSADLKNYTQAPQLVRHWNVSTSLETFVSYSTGRLSWQVGPQVRYQMLSSFVKEYPVKENLFDFGFKVAVSASQLSTLR